MNALKTLTLAPLLTAALVCPSQGAESLSTLSAAVSNLDSKVANHENRISQVEKALKPGQVNEVSVQKPDYKTIPYVIREGDTIGEIARRNEIPRALLLEVNGMKEGQNTYIGDSIQIPFGQTNPPPPPTPVVSPVPSPKPAPGPAIVDKKNAPKPAVVPAKPVPATAQNHTVKSGDTLFGISRRYNVSVDSLKKANNLRSDRLSLGQSIKIPGKTSVVSKTPPTKSTVAEVPATTKETYGVYMVQKGDTLYSLATDFFTTQAEIQRLNKMGSSTALAPGKELVVPTAKYMATHNLANN